jgi:hypothetical protein
LIVFFENKAGTWWERSEIMLSYFLTLGEIVKGPFHFRFVAAPERIRRYVGVRCVRGGRLPSMDREGNGSESASNHRRAKVTRHFCHGYAP